MGSQTERMAVVNSAIEVSLGTQPERLPEVIRTLSLWIGRLKQLLAKTRQDIENEMGMDDIRHQLHNEQVLKDLGESKDQLVQPLENHKTGQP